MQLSVLAHAFGIDLRAALERARQAGFEGVVIDPAAFPAVTDIARTAQREIVRLLDRAGQPPVAIDVRLSTGGLSPAAKGDVEREIARVGNAIDTARGLNAPLVLCDLGPLPPAPDEPAATPTPPITKAALGRLILPDPPAQPKPIQPSLPRDPAFEAAVDHTLRAIGEHADRAGRLIAFRASLGSFASLAAALLRVDCPFFGIDLDPLSVITDAWSLDQVFSRVGPLLRHARVRDAVRGPNGRVMAAELGTGQMDWQELMAALRDSDYRGATTVDPTELSVRPADAAIRAAQRLRQHFA